MKVRDRFIVAAFVIAFLALVGFLAWRQVQNDAARAAHWEETNHGPSN